MTALLLALQLHACAPGDFHRNRYDYHLAAGITLAIPLDLLCGPIQKAGHEEPMKFPARAANVAFMGWGVGFGKEVLDLGLGKKPDLRDAAWTEAGVMGGFFVFEALKWALKPRASGREQARLKAAKVALAQAEAAAMEDDGGYLVTHQTVVTPDGSTLEDWRELEASQARMKAQEENTVEIRGTLTLEESH